MYLWELQSFFLPQTVAAVLHPPPGKEQMWCRAKRRRKSRHKCVVLSTSGRWDSDDTGLEFGTRICLYLSPHTSNLAHSPLSVLTFPSWIWISIALFEHKRGSEWSSPLVKSRGGFLFVVELFCNDCVACTFWLVGKKRGIIVGVWVTNDNAHPFCSTSA